MDENYDVIVCGTGLTECILSGLLSVHGFKVLHIDKNSYYGDESASLNLTNLWNKFAQSSGQGAGPVSGPVSGPPEELGHNRNWNVDLIPKFIMANGKLVKILLKTKVTKYLDWQVIQGSFVYQHQKGGLFTNEKFIHKVPATDTEALSSPLMGPIEKLRCKNFFQFTINYNLADENTWIKNTSNSTSNRFNPHTTNMIECYKSFGLQSNTIDFIGHSIGLYTTDDYLNEPYNTCVERLKLYMVSLAKYGQSPFLYPIYGLGGLPEGFSRLCAVHGGTFILNSKIDSFVYENQNGKKVIKGVKSTDGQIATCKMLVCNPSYVLDNHSKSSTPSTAPGVPGIGVPEIAPGTGTGKVKSIGKVIRVICILNHPIKETGKVSSCQIIIPQKQLNRKNDLYVTLVSHTHGVSLNGYYISIVSTTIETENPLEEVKEGLKLLQPIYKQFVSINNLYVPTDDGSNDHVHVCSSYDATSHFETAADEVLRMWKEITGKELDLTTTPNDIDDDTNT